MKRKNNGKDALVDNRGIDSNIFPVRIMVVDSDEKSLQENVTILQKDPRIYKVTKCNKIDQAITWLKTDGSEFDIILVGECLLAAKKLKLLKIGNARDLLVLVTSADDGIDTITRSIDDGAYAYLPKPIPESVLKLVWTHVYSKRENKFAQVQKLTNDASREKKPRRLEWTYDLKKKFEDSLIDLGGVEDAKPADILKRMETKGIQNIPITTPKIGSYLQKYRERLKKEELTSNESSTLKTESNELPSLDRGIILEDSSLPSNKIFPAGRFENYAGDDDVLMKTEVDGDHGHSNSLLESDVLTVDNNTADGHLNNTIESQLLTMMKVSGTISSHTPAYKDKEGTSSEQVESRYEREENPPMTLPHLNTTNPNQQGFNLPLPIEANASCTSGDQPFINYLPDDLFDGLPSLDRGIILEDSSLPSNKIFPAGRFENYAGDNDVLMKTAVDGDHGHSNGLLESDVLTVDNNTADGHLNNTIESQLLTMMKVSGTISSHTPAYKDKEGTSSEHVESRYEREENPPMTLPHLNTTNPNQQGFNLPLPVEANASCTSGDQPFINYLPDDLFDGLPSLDRGIILEDSSLPSNKIFPAGRFENYAGDDDVLMKTAVDGDHGHSNSLLESEVLTMMIVDNNIVDGHLNSTIDNQLLTMMKVSGTIPSHTPAYKDKEGTSLEHVESRYEKEENPPMTLPHLNTTNPNQQGFNLPLPVEANASCTSGDQPFINYLPDDLFDGLPSLDRGIILEDSSLPSNKIFPAGRFENYAGDDDVLMKTAVDGDHGHSNGLLESDVLTVDNNTADGHLNNTIESQLLTMMKVSGTISSHTPAYKDKEGTSSEHVESRYEREENPPMTLPHLNTTNPNQQGFNLPLPVEANASCTSGDQPFINYLPDDLFDGLPSLDRGIILEDSSLPSNKIFPAGRFENYAGDDDVLMKTAVDGDHGHSNGLLESDVLTVDNNTADGHLNNTIESQLLTMMKVSGTISSHTPAYKDKEGTSSEHVESRYEREENPPMTLPHLNTTNPNQ